MSLIKPLKPWVVTLLLTAVAVAIWCRPVLRWLEHEWALIFDEYRELGVAGAFHGTTTRFGERTRGLLPHAGARLSPRS